MPDNSKSSGKSGAGDDANDGLLHPLHSFFLSLTMILFSEIGDKTFLVAALMAMKHDRMVVFSAALSALIAMTALSAIVGHAVPTLIPQRLTNLMASALFFVFGARLLREGMAMSPDEGVSAEMQEVEMELEEKENLARKQGRRRSSISPYSLEMGLGSRKSRSKSRFPTPPRSPSTSPDRSPSPRRRTIYGFLGGLNNLLSLLLSPAWVQTFVMTFLGEWGDRSQIATFAMAAGQDYWVVTLGAILGHACCTSVAVIGGRAIAGRVSLKVGMSALTPISLVYIVTDRPNSHHGRRRCLLGLRGHLPRPCLLLLASLGSDALLTAHNKHSPATRCSSFFSSKSFIVILGNHSHPDILRFSHLSSWWWGVGAGFRFPPQKQRPNRTRKYIMPDLRRRNLAGSHVH